MNTKQKGIDAVAGRLESAKHPRVQRQGRDLSQLGSLTDGLWKDRLLNDQIVASPDGSLAITFNLKCTGLTYSNEVQRSNDFTVGILIPIMYPLVMPIVKFLNGSLPFNPHVFDTRFLPDMARLSEQHRAVAEQGAGHCCYLREQQWSHDLFYTLSLALWLVSRVLCLEAFQGEAMALNPQAREYALQLKEKGELPLGLPLPAPWKAEATSAFEHIASQQGVTNVAWED